MAQPSTIKKNGYTLLELIVVLGIVAMLSALMFSNYRRGEQSNTLRSTTEGVESVLREMQNNILSGLPYAGTSAARDYGVKLGTTQTNYESFVEEAVTSNYTSLQVYNYPAKVVVTNLSVNLAGVIQNATYVEIKFTPPYGQIAVTAKNGASTLFTEQKNVITTWNMQHQGTNQTMPMTVDGISGRITR